MKSKILNFLTNEDGQSTTEYILILSVVVMIVIKFRKTFEGQLNQLIGNVGTQMSEATRE